MFSQIKDRKHIEHNLYSVAKVVPGVGLQGAGGVKNFSLGICDGAPSPAGSSLAYYNSYTEYSITDNSDTYDSTTDNKATDNLAYNNSATDNSSTDNPTTNYLTIDNSATVTETQLLIT